MELWNKDRARQLISFDDMPFGATDIDGVTDHHGRIFVWYEVKHRGNEAPLGQKIALQNLVSLAAEARKHAIAMIVEHDIDNTQEDVVLNECRIRELITSENMEWRPPKKLNLAGEMASAYINYWEKRNNVVRLQNRL